MRTFLTLDTSRHEVETGLLFLTMKDGGAAQVALRREGDYVALSGSYGPVEISLRLRYEELRRTLARLQPIGGLQTARQVGTNNAYLAVGRRQDNTLIVKPTLISDASGYLSLNLALTPELKDVLYTWLSIEGGD